MNVRELFRFNEWWDTWRVDERNLERYKRYLFPQILKFLPDRQMILITGLRRVGKTKLMYQAIQHLLDGGAAPRKILYFSFDEEKFDVREVMETYRAEVLRKDFKDVDRVYVFFDEVHKVEGWENKVKVYYDLNPNVKFILSGSASLVLSRKARESLAGRIYEFVLKPLTFREFLEMKGVSVAFEDAELFGEKILPYFSDFRRKAGFPEMINEDDDEKIKAYVKSSVLERVVYRDIPKEFGKVDVELLETLVNIFSKTPGMFLNYENLSRDLRRNKRTLMNYVYYLKFSLLVNLVSNFRPSALASSRKNRKVYPSTPALTFSLVERFDEEVLSKVLETMFCTEVGAKYYFRKGGKEIDFLLLNDKNIVPVEIKLKVSVGDLRNFASLVRKHDLNGGIVLTYDEFKAYDEKGVKILVYPLWAFLLFKEEILGRFYEALELAKVGREQRRHQEG